MFTWLTRSQKWEEATIAASGPYGHYYDCYHGVPLAVATGGGNGSSVRIDVEARGYGCVWASRLPASADAQRFLASMADLVARDRRGSRGCAMARQHFHVRG